MADEIAPSSIRYSQDSIKTVFRDGKRLEDTFRELLYDEVSVYSLRTLRIVMKDGYWYVASGNRRLYLYKHLERAGKLKTVPVHKSSYMNPELFTTNNEGRSIRVRGDRYFEITLNRLINEWRQSKNQSPRYPGSSSMYSFDRSPSWNGGTNDETWTDRQSRITQSTYRPRPDSPRSQTFRERVEDDNPPPRNDSWCVIL